MYADISVVNYNGKKNQSFTYQVKSSENLKIGSLVSIVFSKKESLGVIRKIYKTKPKDVFKILEINKILDYQLPIFSLSLADWMMDYYASSNHSVWQLFIPRNIKSKPRNILVTNNRSAKEELAILNKEQKIAIDKINRSDKPVLLQGVMGSGKTELYFHLISSAIKNKRSSIILMPEIMLTKQMIQRAKNHFADKLIITHSEMTNSERRNAWIECNKRSQNEPVVVMGPRSAIFMPVFNLGLIVVDECHEGSYKQDSSPRYSTDHVAAKLCSLSSSKLVMGSATPPITAKYLVGASKLELVKINSRAVGSEHPEIEILDTKKSSDVISKKMEEIISKNIDDKNMTLIYVNRRGTAPLYMCNDCSQSIDCPNCGTSLSLHSDKMKLVCHICDYKITPPAICSNCGSSNMKGVGMGTKAFQTILSDKFHRAKITRIDKDSKTQKISFDSIKRSDIIIGTQMIAKGIDIANLTTVIIPFADYDLSKIDYTSREKAFQLITQTAGRAGRREKRGHVYIQTKRPDDEIFEFITNNDYEKFCENELKMRKKYSYPPYSYLLKLECGYKNENLGRDKIISLLKEVSKGEGLAILGPTKSHPYIRKGKHFWTLILKSKSRKKLQKIAAALDSNWRVDLDPNYL